jgi:Na+/melibiose symporter-like transporter
MIEIIISFFLILMALLSFVYYLLDKELSRVQTQINSLKKPEMTFEDAKDIVESEGYSLIKNKQ